MTNTEAVKGTDLSKARQRDMILRYMKEEGSITPLDAIREFGCLRLGARIWDLKNIDGIRIKAEMETHKNRYGKTVSYARYSLEQ